MHDAGSQSSNRSELLGAGDCPVRLHASGDVFADGNDVRNFIVLIRAHRNFADEPVIGVALFRDSFLLNAMDVARGKDGCKFSLQQLAALFG